MQNFILSKSTFHWFQWISMNFHEWFLIQNHQNWSKMVSGHRLTFNSPNMLQCTSKTVQIFLKCGQIRIMLLMNEFEFGPYLVHLWSVLGERDLYNKRYSFEQNHKMLNPNHLRNVQPHLFVEKKSKILNFNLNNSK